MTTLESPAPKQRKQRAKSPPAKTPMPQRGPKKPENHRLTQLWKDPEWRAKQIALLKGKIPNRGRPIGVPDGNRKKWLDPVREKAKEESKVIVEKLIAMEVFKPDNDVANEAVRTLIETIRTPNAVKDKISAASKLLEFTQKKPMASSEVTLNKAEAFLEAVLQETSSAEGTSGGS